MTNFPRDECVDENPANASHLAICTAFTALVNVRMLTSPHSEVHFVYGCYGQVCNDSDSGRTSHFQTLERAPAFRSCPWQSAGESMKQ